MGAFNYTIEYNDSNGQFGIPNTVIVTIKLDQVPTCNQPADFTTSEIGSEMIYLRLYDDFGSGQYRVWVNDTNVNYYKWVDWAPWINNTPIYIPINRTLPGIFNYTIEYTSNTGQAAKYTLFVTITSSVQPPNQSNLPLLFAATQGRGDILSLLLSPIALGIIVGIAVLFIILTLLLVRNNKTVKELNKKIDKLESSIKTAKKSIEK